MVNFLFLRHTILVILINGMTLFPPNYLFAAFDSNILSPIQNAAGAFPFSVYRNSLSSISDPSNLTSAQPLFGAGIGYKPSSLSTINVRLSSSWNEWNFNIVPVVRAAMQVNLSI